MILTAIMFVVENFDGRVNTIEMGRGFRLDHIFATLYLIQSRLQKSYTYIQYIIAHTEAAHTVFRSNNWIRVVRHQYISHRMKYLKKQVKDMVFFANLYLSEIQQEYEVTKVFHKNLTEYEIAPKDLHV